MTPQELKNSILLLAVQGKLVEQRAEEGTAEELYKKIQAEKQKLTAEKKIKKEKPLPEITAEEIPFDIPESWKWIRVNDFCYFSDGEKISGITYPYLEAKYLRGGIEAKLKDNGKIVYTDTYVILVDGENSGEIFKVKENGYLGSTFKVINICSNVFIEFALKYFEFYRNEFKNNKKGAAIPHLNKDLFFSKLFPLPPLEEQKRIVSKIEELLPQIDRYERAWGKLEEFNKRFPENMQKSILQYAVQGKLVEQRAEEGTAEELYKKIQAEKQKLIVEKKIKKEKPLPEITAEENPFDIPESWKWVRLGEIAVFQGGYAYKSTDYVPKSSNQIIRLGNIRQGNFLPKEKQVFISDDLANETQQYRIKENDILVSMTGTRRKKDYFYAVIIDRNIMNDKKYYLNQRVGCFRVLDDILPRFLWYVLKCEIIRQAIFLKETGTANQGNLSSEDIKMFVYVPLPPLEEQKRIVTKIEELLPLCERLKK